MDWQRILPPEFEWTIGGRKQPGSKDRCAPAVAAIRALTVEQEARPSPSAAYQDKAVLARFTHSHIEALDAAAIVGFLSRWSRALFQKGETRAERHREEFAAALGARPATVRNPVATSDARVLRALHGGSYYSVVPIVAVPRTRTVLRAVRGGFLPRQVLGSASDLPGLVPALSPVQGLRLSLRACPAPPALNL